jgi:hypothetical protein
MEVVVIALVLIVVFIMFEYRLRTPDQIVLFETKTGFGMRKGKFYPRHFSLALPRTAYSFNVTIDASAKGNLDIRVKLAVSIAASFDNLETLILVGGWTTSAVTQAAKELEVLLQSFVKEYTEHYEIEELSSDKIRDYLHQKVHESKKSLGLEIISLAINSYEPVNTQIAEALRQREHARILEQSETLNQQARIAAAKAKLKADEEIAFLENELELKKYDLKKVQLEKETALANKRVEHELTMSRMKLDFEREELDLLKENPELLLLTPQAARLAEASQSLKNAQTIVSLSPNDVAQGSELLGMFHTFLRNTLETYRKKKEKK